MNKHPGVNRSTLVDAVNNKCANYRRKTKDGAIVNDSLFTEEQ